jgi:hypothetical protein
MLDKATPLRTELQALLARAERRADLGVGVVQASVSELDYVRLGRGPHGRDAKPEARRPLDVVPSPPRRDARCATVATWLK